MTNAECVAFCRREGPYRYAGTEYSRECWCGNELKEGADASEGGDADCEMPCGGKAEEACGGPKHLTLYRTTAKGAEEVGSVGNWHIVGCWT